MQKIKLPAARSARLARAARNQPPGSRGLAFPGRPRLLQEGEQHLRFRRRQPRSDSRAKRRLTLQSCTWKKGALRLLPPVGGFPKDLLLDGQPAKEQVLFADDADKPSKLTIGTITVIVIHATTDSPCASRTCKPRPVPLFHGLRWYEPNPAYRVHARWIPYNPPKTLDIPTVLRHHTHMPAPGAAEFTIDGKVVRLEPVLEDPKATDLFFILRDATSKTNNLWRGTFPLHRFSDHGLNQPANSARLQPMYNPPCSFITYAPASASAAQPAQRAVPAGEQRYPMIGDNVCLGIG